MRKLDQQQKGWPGVVILIFTCLGLTPVLAEELALALTEDWRPAMEARYEEDDSGAPRIRVVDTQSGETVAVVTPEELRALAVGTGLPPGLLMRTVR
jgi:hypothetical protein